MAPQLIPLALPTGIVRAGTAYSSRGRWYGSNLIRWVGGVARPVGGWTLVRTGVGGEIQATGFPRGAHAWRKADSTSWLATGTQTKVYVYSNAVLTDVTPAVLTAGQTDGQLLTGTGTWGTSQWGNAPWGGYVAAGTVRDADTWAFDNFGEIMVAVSTADGKVYSATPNAQLTQVTNSPTGCRAVCVTAERFVFALGASSDPRNIAWPSQGTLTTWTPGPGNSAGSFPLQTSGRLMAGVSLGGETLLWTDSDLWSAVYIGGSLYYSFRPRGDHCGLLGPTAWAEVSGVAYWMGDGKFYSYAGVVRELPCAVQDFVFGNLNKTQKAKIAAVTFSQFNEVCWFYPSVAQSGLENDSYVKVNVNTGDWDIGTLARAAGCDVHPFSQPLMWAPDGRLYSHETGNDRQGLAAYLESGPLEIGNGDRVVLVEQMLPDEKVSGQVTATFYSSDTPEAAETVSGPYTVKPRTDVRFSGRQIRVKLAEPVSSGAHADATVLANNTVYASGTSTGTDFRIGTFRLSYILGGRR